MKRCLMFMLMMLIFSEFYAQDYQIEISLYDTKIIDECHFGDEWKAYFDFGGRYMYSEDGEAFTLKPNSKFDLRSMIYEGNETYSDYEEITTEIAYKDLDVGSYNFKVELYIEDENTGRYHCNNATFEFTYTMEVKYK